MLIIICCISTLHVQIVSSGWGSEILEHVMLVDIYRMNGLFHYLYCLEDNYKTIYFIRTLKSGFGMWTFPDLMFLKYKENQTFTS